MTNKNDLISKLSPQHIQDIVKTLSEGNDWPTNALYFLQDIMPNKKLRVAFLAAYNDLDEGLKKVMKEQHGDWTRIKAYNEMNPKKPHVMTPEMFDFFEFESASVATHPENNSMKNFLTRFILKRGVPL